MCLPEINWPVLKLSLVFIDLRKRKGAWTNCKTNLICVQYEHILQSYLVALVIVFEFQENKRTDGQTDR